MLAQTKLLVQMLRQLEQRQPAYLQLLMGLTQLQQLLEQKISAWSTILQPEIVLLEGFLFQSDLFQNFHSS